MAIATIRGAREATAYQAYVRIERSPMTIATVGQFGSRGLVGLLAAHTEVPLDSTRTLLGTSVFVGLSFLLVREIRCRRLLWHEAYESIVQRWRAFTHLQRAALFLLVIMAWTSRGVFIYRGLPHEPTKVYGYHDETKLCAYASAYPVSALCYRDLRYPTGYPTLVGLLTLPLRLPAILAFAARAGPNGAGDIMGTLISRQLMLVVGRHISVVVSVIGVLGTFWLGTLLFRRFWIGWLLAWAAIADPIALFCGYIFKPDVALSACVPLYLGAVISAYRATQPRAAWRWSAVAVIILVFAGSFKYTAVCFIPAILLIPLNPVWRRSWNWRRAVHILTAAVVLLSFLCLPLLLQPFALLEALEFELHRSQALHDPLATVFLRNFGNVGTGLVLLLLLATTVKALLARHREILAILSLVLPVILIYRNFAYMHYLAGTNVLIGVCAFYCLDWRPRPSWGAKSLPAPVAAFLLVLSLYLPPSLRHGAWLLKHASVEQSAADIASKYVSPGDTYAYTQFQVEPDGRLRILPGQRISDAKVASDATTAGTFVVRIRSPREWERHEVLQFIGRFASNGPGSELYYQYQPDAILDVWRLTLNGEAAPLHLLGYDSFVGRDYREFGATDFRFHVFVYSVADSHRELLAAKPASKVVGQAVTYAGSDEEN